MFITIYHFLIPRKTLYCNILNLFLNNKANHKLHNYHFQQYDNIYIYYFLHLICIYNLFYLNKNDFCNSHKILYLYLKENNFLHLHINYHLLKKILQFILCKRLFLLQNKSCWKHIHHFYLNNDIHHIYHIFFHLKIVYNKLNLLYFLYIYFLFIIKKPRQTFYTISKNRFITIFCFNTFSITYI